MANVSSSNGLEKRPKLRFPGFDEPYRTTHLEEISTLVNRTDPKSNAPIMMLSSGNGFIMQSVKYSRDNAGQSLKKYILLKQGELAYNHGASKAKQFGCCYELTEPEARIPYVYHCFKVSDTEYTPFVAATLNNPKMDKQLKRLVSSSVRMDGLLNISFDDYMSVSLHLPSFAEQEKIADFLKKLDERITAQETLVASLKKYKRGVSTYLFDSNCSHPKSSPIWSKVRINDIASIFIGEFVIKTKQSPSAPYPVYNGGTSFTGLYDDYNQEGNRVLVSARGANAGFVNKVNGKCWIGNSCYAISLFENAPIFFDYLYHYLKFNQGKLIESQQSANIPSISKKQLQDFNVEFPDLNAQQEIVQFLNCLDAKINYEEKKFSAFGSLRLGLLQQLFI